MAAFLFSGLVHELVITVPAGGGYGGPTFFFLFQASAVAFEHSAFGRAICLGSEWGGRAFTAFALTAPLGCLFSPRFVANVVLPFLDALGAGSAH